MPFLASMHCRVVKVFWHRHISALCNARMEDYLERILKNKEVVRSFEVSKFVGFSEWKFFERRLIGGEYMMR